MSGHVLRVTFDRDMVHLAVECYELPGSECRVICRQGCESWNYKDHPHDLDPLDYCNAVEWLSQGDIEDQCDIHDPFRLHDGMPINVAYEESRGYTWQPVLGSHFVEIVGGKP